MKRPEERSEEFLNLIKEWQALEETTIASADELISKTDNLLVKATMEMIKRDSEKHKVMLQMVIDNLTKEAVHLSPDELAPISALVNRHMEIESKFIALANNAIGKSELSTIKFILNALLEEEAKHHGQLYKLNEELKKATIFVT